MSRVFGDETGRAAFCIHPPRAAVMSASFMSSERRPSRSASR